MAFGLDDGLMLANGVGSIIQGFGAARRLKEAQEQRQRLISQVGANLDKERQDLYNNNLQSLRSATGMAGDALRTTGANMGAADAAAGVYNSSATAGALANQANASGAQIAGMGQQMFANDQQQLHDNQNSMLNMQLGFDKFGRPNGTGANGDIAQAQQDQGQIGAGFGQLVGAFGGMNSTNALNKMRAAGNSAINPIQSNVQTQPGVGVNNPGVQAMSIRNNGPMMNGNQGGMAVQPYSGSGMLSQRRRLF